MTGGGAIYHADEITYSLVGPVGQCGFPQRAADIFEKVHTAIAGGLSCIGIDANLSDAPTGRSASVCFERPQKYDIVVDGRKLLGSAQRRHGAHFLQHGSLPLSANRFAAGATSVGQLVAKRPPDSTIIDAIAGALADSFGVVFVNGRLSDEEEAEARRLAAGKYSSAEWNRKR
jgi:lipoate-protein ligase A